MKRALIVSSVVVLSLGVLSPVVVESSRAVESVPVVMDHSELRTIALPDVVAPVVESPSRDTWLTTAPPVVEPWNVPVVVPSPVVVPDHSELRTIEPEPVPVEPTPVAPKPVPVEPEPVPVPVEPAPDHSELRTDEPEPELVDPESESSDIEAAYEYCGTLPTDAEVDECIAAAELEFLGEPVVPDYVEYPEDCEGLSEYDRGICLDAKEFEALYEECDATSDSVEAYEECVVEGELFLDPSSTDA